MNGCRRWYSCLWSREQHAVADGGPLMATISTSRHQIKKKKDSESYSLARCSDWSLKATAYSGTKLLTTSSVLRCV